MHKPIVLSAGLLAASILAPAHLGWAQAGAINPRPIAPVPAQRHLQLAQADVTVRTNQLEEQIRLLNGRIEELTFQLLQMQEQLRRMQEDNEFRFQDLESRKRRTGSTKLAGNDRKRTGPQPGKQQPSEQVTSAQRSDGDEIARLIDEGPVASDGRRPKRMIDGVELYDGSQDQDGGLQPETLGRLVFDAQGNLVGAQAEKPIDLTAQSGTSGQFGQAVQPSGNDLAALSLPNDPDALYNRGYSLIQAGDYLLAEEVFGDFAIRFPDHPRLPEAKFWLGESLYAQANYQEAARVFLQTHKQYPNGRLGAQTLLKLGMSLSAMNQRELACATFAEMPRKYPGMSAALLRQLQTEQRSTRCAVN